MDLNLSLLLYLVIPLGILVLVSTIQTAFKSGLRNLPGPFLARFSGLYRLSMVYRGQSPVEYRRIHQKYGQIVRVGPNHVSISDPAAISQIYGIGSNYLKVWRHL